MVVFIGHALVDGSIDLNVNVVTNFVGGKCPRDVDGSHLSESFSKFVSGLAPLPVAMGHSQSLNILIQNITFSLHQQSQIMPHISHSYLTYYSMQQLQFILKGDKKLQSPMSQPIFHNRRHSLAISRTINEKGSPLKKKICAEYLPKYYRKLKLSNKKVMSPSEDRLTELTTKQIDRLIEMQKIKSLLNDNKKGIRPTHINYVESAESFRHPNVYQPNFMAKINRIALERNIRHLRSQQFDEATLSPKELRQRGLELQKKNLRFVKQYKVDCQKKASQSYQQNQEKSISSIEDCTQQFERTLEDKKAYKSEVHAASKLSKFRHKKTNILSMTRWFNGMSTFYLNLDKPGTTLSNKPDDRPTFDRNFDLEYQNSYIKKPQSKSLSKFYNSRMSTVA